jgi:hypothetical protein
MLADSVIAPDVAAERHYSSVMNTPAVLADCGFSRDQQQLVPGLLIRVHSLHQDGTGHGQVGYQFRPDRPRVDARGRTRKYETPSGGHMVLDVHPRCRPYIGDPTVPLIVLEGIRKGDACVSAGARCVIVLLGVWSWRGTNPMGGKTALTEWDAVATNGRLVHLIYDSDAQTNPHVWKARDRLARFLERRGARVLLVNLPPGPDGAKRGADDFLAGR